ncbi:MAG: efflux transporter outer membrane subunit [Dechloromonas sp.]|nr:efflux transporter outer membrane subunit [Dechloromonas sp.]
MPFRPLTAISLVLLLGGCAVGPDYARPPLATPAAFHAAPEHWKLAEPAEAGVGESWWTIFDDPLLDRLVAAAEQANQDIVAADAAYRQARAAIGASRAALFPGLDGSVSSSRGQTANSNGSINTTRTTDRVGLSSAWEIDLWGRLRRGLEAGTANAGAGAADLAAVRLSVQASVVQAYLQLRINDAQLRLLDRTLGVYRRSHEITRNRYESGVASQADVAQAESQLRSTEAQQVDLGIQRAQLEHALAVLQGRFPGETGVPPADGVPRLPEVPPALPSALLERRPDVAAAERRVAAANAQIGVAQAAFFPRLTINASGGYQNSSFADLLSAPHRFWSLGPAFALTLFDAGARASQKEQAIAAYDRSVAGYRQTVLSAFREVEDDLAALRVLAQERDIQQQATGAANEFQALTHNQYLAGTVSFLNVATAQAAALNAERSQLELLNRQLLATVGLIQALGGSPWTAAAVD